MAITHRERFVSPGTSKGNGKDDQATDHWHVFTDSNESELQVRLYCLANLPSFYEGLTRKTLRLQREEAVGVWQAEQLYTSPSDERNKPQPNPGEGYQWSIKSGGGQSVNQLRSDELVAESVAADHAAEWALIEEDDEVALLMGFSENAEGQVKVGGLPIEIGGVEINVSFAISATDVTANYLVNAAGWAARRAVNSTAWNGFPAKTLRLTNFQSVERNEETAPGWDCSMDFVYEPEITITVGALSVTKAGQHVLDEMTQYKKVGTKDFSLPEIIRLAVHRVRPEIDYATDLLLADPYGSADRSLEAQLLRNEAERTKILELIAQRDA